ncbi:MAG: aldo/keto reductase [Gemmatimonadales bacterium]
MSYDIPPIIVGAWQLSRGHNVEPPDTERVLDAFSNMVEAGLTTFDCADIYTDVEKLLGDFLGRYHGEIGQNPPPPISIHTKFVPDRDILSGITKTYTEAIINRSRERLGVDCLDLVQLGWWDYKVPYYVDAAVWLRELAEAGKIRRIGATNFDVTRLREIVDTDVPIFSHQVQYSLLDHRPERGMVEFCHEHGIHLLCYGTLAGGFLSERWLNAPEPAEPLPNRSLTKYKLIIDEFWGWTAFQELLAAIHDIATKHGVSIGNVATRYVLDRPQVAAVIIGARSDDHLADNLRTLALELDEEDTETLRELTVHRTPPGDVYELERRQDGSYASIMRYNLNADDLPRMID